MVVWTVREYTTWLCRFPAEISFHSQLRAETDFTMPMFRPVNCHSSWPFTRMEMLVKDFTPWRGMMNCTVPPSRKP